jgi:hypothetical protein
MKNFECVDFLQFNATTKKDPYPSPFIEKVLDKIMSHEVYSFLDGFFNYHQIMIAPEYRYKTTFITYWGTFIWGIMLFEFKNVPPTYQWALSMGFMD